MLRPHYDSGLKYPDKNNPLPTDVLWGGGVRAGLKWDGTFYRDMNRYGQSGSLFWSAYLKPGSGPGIKNGFWFNFGGGWCHLANDDPAQILTGAAPRLFWDAGVVAPVPCASGGAAGTAAATSGQWKLVTRRMTQNHVAAGLVIHVIADFPKRADGVGAATDRESTHTGTSMISSVTGPGTGSPCFSRLWR